MIRLKLLTIWLAIPVSLFTATCAIAMCADGYFPCGGSRGVEICCKRGVEKCVNRVCVKKDAARKCSFGLYKCGDTCCKKGVEECRSGVCYKKNKPCPPGYVKCGSTCCKQSDMPKYWTKPIDNEYGACVTRCSKRSEKDCIQNCKRPHCPECRSIMKRCRLICKSEQRQRERRKFHRCEDLKRHIDNLRSEISRLKSQEKELVKKIIENRRRIANLPEAPSDTNPNDILECEKLAAEYMKGQG